MLRPSLPVMGVIFVAFISGMGFGLYMGSGSSSVPGTIAVAANQAPGTSPDSVLPDHDGADTLLKFHNQELEKELAAQKQNVDAVILADRLAFFKKYQVAPRAFGEDLKVEPAMAEFLKMTDAERKAIDAHLAQISAETKKFEQQNLKLVKQTDNSVIYQISAFPEGKGMRDDLQKMIESELGADRAEVFFANSKWEFNELYAGFGVSNTTIEVKRTDQSGSPSYSLKETYGDGSAEERGIGTTLPARYAGLLQLDPSP